MADYFGYKKTILSPDFAEESTKEECMMKRFVEYLLRIKALPLKYEDDEMTFVFDLHSPWTLVLRNDGLGHITAMRDGKSERSDFISATLKKDNVAMLEVPAKVTTEEGNTTGNITRDYAVLLTKLMWGRAIEEVERITERPENAEEVVEQFANLLEKRVDQ